MDTAVEFESITITHEQILRAAKQLAFGKLGYQWDELSQVVQHEYIGLAKIAFSAVGINIEPNADGTCGKVNSDYPEHQCIHPAGHGIITMEDDEDVTGEHGDHTSVWSGH